MEKTRRKYWERLCGTTLSTYPQIPLLNFLLLPFSVSLCSCSPLEHVHPPSRARSQFRPGRTRGLGRCVRSSSVPFSPKGTTIGCTSCGALVSPLCRSGTYLFHCTSFDPTRTGFVALIWLAFSTKPRDVGLGLFDRPLFSPFLLARSNPLALPLKGSRGPAPP